MGLLGTNLVRLNAPALKQSVGWFWQQLPKLAKAPVIEKIGEDVLFLSGRYVSAESKQFQNLNQAQKLLATAHFMWRKLTLPFHSALFKQYGDAVKTTTYVKENAGKQFVHFLNYTNPLYNVSLLPAVAEKALKQNAQLIKDGTGGLIQEVSGFAGRHTGKFIAHTEQVYSKLVPKETKQKLVAFNYNELAFSLQKELRAVGHRIHFYVMPTKPDKVAQEWAKTNANLKELINSIK
jgi:hypothetical protein